MGEIYPEAAPDVHPGLRAVRFDDFLVNQPFLDALRVRADQKDLLHRPRSCVQAFQTRLGRILDLEARRRLAAPSLDPARDDAGHERAVLDDVVEQFVEATDAAVLALDAAELHGKGS